MVGMSTSVITKSGRSARAFCRPSAPSDASTMRWPARPSTASRNCRLVGVSSTIRILGMVIRGHPCATRKSHAVQRPRNHTTYRRERRPAFPKMGGIPESARSFATNFAGELACAPGLRKRIARQRRRPPAEMGPGGGCGIYSPPLPRRRPRIIGAFKSGRHDLGQRAEEMLAGFGEDQ